jgi:hypothetical protein
MFSEISLPVPSQQMTMFLPTGASILLARSTGAPLNHRMIDSGRAGKGDRGRQAAGPNALAYR